MKRKHGMKIHKEQVNILYQQLRYEKETWYENTNLLMLVVGKFR